MNLKTDVVLNAMKIKIQLETYSRDILISYGII